MKAIRKQRNCYALLLAVSICLTMWFGVAFVVEAAFALGAISITSFILLVRQSRLLSAASLIWDNRILAVPSANVFTADGQGKNGKEESVVSTFGMLIGSKIYKWGCDGIHGVRLKLVEIDRERMYLTFGDGIQTMRVELLHGIVEQQKVSDVSQKLWRETGVTVTIIGW
jgi:hypothetical protein